DGAKQLSTFPNQLNWVWSMIPFVRYGAGERTQKPTADEAGCDPSASGARHPSIRRGGCLDRRDERIAGKGGRGRSARSGALSSQAGACPSEDAFDHPV